MWIVQMNNNGPVENGLAELNHDIQNELKEVRNGATGEGQGLSEEDESQINEDVEDINDGSIDAGQVNAQDGTVSEGPQQHPQEPLVQWERFLALRSLKVLLVESDDSTRHVISALLRNCGYEVTAVANGLQAWKLLADLTNPIHLVLSEVVTPCISGFGLLSKIMNHKTRKNIPVIMMSSHDSMKVVFKCLSKGAVDFLVKPIRKNELKNLWQHIWRKYHSSSDSGSGSESAVRTQKSIKSKSAEDSDNQTGSNYEDEIGSTGLHVNGSGTQSSWTERAVEVESPKSMTPWSQLAVPPDNTCAQVIHSRSEVFGTNLLRMTTMKKCQQQDDKFGNAGMGKDLEIGVTRIRDMQLEDPSNKLNAPCNHGEKVPESNLKYDGEQIDKEPLELNSDKSKGEPRNQAANVVGVSTNCTDPQTEGVILETPNAKDKVICKDKEVPFLKLSLKRTRDSGDSGNSHDRNVLKHSDFSAFSRYNSSSNANEAPTGIVGSCSPVENSAEAAITESMQQFQSNPKCTHPNQHSNGSSNNNDMVSSTNNACSKPTGLRNEPAPKSTVKRSQPSSGFQPVQNSHVLLHRPETADASNTNSTSDKAMGATQQFQVQHHHHHYHHHHHHVHQQQPAANEEPSLKDVGGAAPLCGSSNMISTHNTVNYNLNGHASGSDQGSNGQNGSSTALNPRETNIESNGIAGSDGIDVGTRCQTTIAVGQNRFAQREAALNKFRQKRKERCFEKKVRYQSRKQLAEQRPRIRGQFVRQVKQDNKDMDEHR